MSKKAYRWMGGWCEDEHERRKEEKKRDKRKKKGEKKKKKNWVGNNVQRGVRKIRKNDLNVTCNKNRQTGRSQSRGRRFSKKGWEGGFSDQTFVTWDRGTVHGRKKKKQQGT